MTEPPLYVEKIKLGFVGAGGIARVQARYLKEMPSVEIVAVADVDRGRALDFAKTWCIPEHNVFTDYSEMMDVVEMDAVTVCTPHAIHSRPAIEALKRGLHVLVEKPMASSGREALEMWKWSLKAGKVLMVGFQTRFSPELKAARRIVAEGSLGRIYYGETTLGGRRRGIPGLPTFVKRQLAGGGVLLDLGCYALDNAMYILGFPRPLSVSAVTASALGVQEEAVVECAWPWKPSEFEVEDFVAAFIRFDCGLTLLLKESWAMHAETLGSTFFLGTRGGLRLHPLEIYRDEWGYMTNTTLKLPKVDPFKEKMKAFVEAVKNNNPPPIDPREIVLEQFVMDAIYESARLRREVKVVVPSELLSGVKAEPSSK